MPADPTNDLNATIAAAVQARIEAEVLAALSGSEVVGQYVAATLNQTINVPDGNGYRTRRTTFIKNATDNALQLAVKAALQKILAEEQEAVEVAVRAALREDLDTIASAFTRNLTSMADNGYGIEVKFSRGDR